MLSGTTDVQQRLGFPDSKGTATVEKLFDPMNGDIYNDFAKFMIQRIGFSFIHQQHWENPLKEFFKQKLYYGNTVSETMLGWIKGHSFDMDAEDQFKTYYPDGLQAFHSINHEFTYPITVTRQQMRRACAEEYGLNQLIAQVMSQPMNADEYDIYGEMLELFPRMDHHYGLPRHKLSTAPRSFPHTPSTRPTHLKITTRNTIANKIDMISPPVKQNLEDFFGLLYSHCQHL